ncbi:hypothetical protein [Streptomyces sp. NPDC048710]|uniref:hypothetical protein n=1 Tax=unclassified Streptomyces TaxID=2593676 RepID=UPI00371184F4
MPWLVFDEDGKAVQPVRRFLIDFIAGDNRTGSVRSYACETSVQVGDFVLWLGSGALLAFVTKPRTAHLVKARGW